MWLIPADICLLVLLRALTPRGSGPEWVRIEATPWMTSGFNSCFRKLRSTSVHATAVSVMNAPWFVCPTAAGASGLVMTNGPHEWHQP